MMMRFLVFALLLQDSSVKQVLDIPYYEGNDADPKKHKLNLFLPKTDKPFPVLMWIHGGAWTSGDRALYAGLGQRLAEAGVGCAAISYRLSPAVKHPEHIKDCARAFAWLWANIKKHGGDPDRLFVSGQSAGGHLSALLALDRKYLADLKVPENAIKGAVPMSGVYVIVPLPEDSKGPLAILPRAFGSDKDVCRDASPITHVKTCKVPMLVITETDDTFMVRPSMTAFKAALEQAGAKDVSFMDAEGRNHISIVVQMMRAGADPARDAIAGFVKKRCRELDGKK